jgi:hypothetical protein
MQKMTAPVYMSKVDQFTFLVQPKIKPSSGPLFFSRSLKRGVGNVISNGSFSLVDTGEKKLLVTCQHVLKGFREMSDMYPKLVMCACLDDKSAIPLNLNSLIDEDKGFDLATFDMEPMISACIGRVFAPLNYGHVTTVKKGDLLAFIGCPARYRSETNEGVHWGRAPHVVIVEDVSGNSIITKTNRVVDVKNRERLYDKHDNPFGGVSGSPAFLMKNYSSTELIGFAIEDWAHLGIFRFTSSKVLNRDGTLRR